jgi:hypothetical protein
VKAGAAVPAGTIAGAASTAYINAFAAVTYVTDVTVGGSGIMNTLEWTLDKVKTADDYNMKMYAQTAWKYAHIAYTEYNNAMEDYEDFMDYISKLLGLPGIGEDCSKTLVCEFWTGLFCGPYFKCIPRPDYIINDMFYDMKNIGNIFKSLDSDITSTFSSKNTNDYCRESTKPFRPLLKALAATNDNWDGFFDTISLSAAVAASAATV